MSWLIVILPTSNTGSNRTSCVVLHVHLKDEISERPVWDWGWRHADSAPFSLLPVPWESKVFGLSWALLFCCYHSIFDFQLKRLLSASYIIPCDEGKPQTGNENTPSGSPHLYSLCQQVGRFPLDLSHVQRQRSKSRWKVNMLWKRPTEYANRKFLILVRRQNKGRCGSVLGFDE